MSVPPPVHANYLGSRHDRKQVPRKLRNVIDHSHPNHVCSPHHVRIPAHCRLKKVPKKKVPKEPEKISETVPDHEFDTAGMLAINSNSYFS